MALKLNGTNSEAAPAYAGDDADTGLQCGTNELKLVTGGSAKATVDSSGRLGVGTTSPTSLIHGQVSSGSAITTLESTATSGEASVSLKGKNSSGTVRTGIFKYDSADRFRIGTTAGIPIAFETNDTERMRILSSGGITFNGDTAAANALHDYEEGTFTPRIVIENVGNVTLYSNKKGSYVKVGSTVTVWFNVALDGTPSGRSTSNAIEFHDLPFTSTNDSNGGAAMYVGSVRINDVDTSHTYGNLSEVIIRLNNNNTMGRIVPRDASSSGLANGSLWLKDNTTIHATITYRTDS